VSDLALAGPAMAMLNRSSARVAQQRRISRPRKTPRRPCDLLLIRSDSERTDRETGYAAVHGGRHVRSTYALSRRRLQHRLAASPAARRSRKCDAATAMLSAQATDDDHRRRLRLHAAESI